jgi:hypothetical protein
VKLAVLENKYEDILPECPLGNQSPSQVTSVNVEPTYILNTHGSHKIE